MSFLEVVHEFAGGGFSFFVYGGVLIHPSCRLTVLGQRRDSRPCEGSAKFQAQVPDIIHNFGLVLVHCDYLYLVALARAHAPALSKRLARARVSAMRHGAPCLGLYS